MFKQNANTQDEQIDNLVLQLNNKNNEVENYIKITKHQGDDIETAKLWAEKAKGLMKEKEGLLARIAQLEQELQIRDGQIQQLQVQLEKYQSELVHVNNDYHLELDAHQKTKQGSMQMVDVVKKLE